MIVNNMFKVTGLYLEGNICQNESYQEFHSYVINVRLLASDFSVMRQMFGGC